MKRIGVGIVGLGFVGRLHAKAYAAERRARLVAFADSDPGCLRRDASGGLAGLDLPGKHPTGAVRVYRSVDELLDDREVEAVSICVPTPLHPGMTEAALARGKHVLVEKPLALRGAEADAAARDAGRHEGLVCMPAMCMRFWPGWSWLQEAIRKGALGGVRAASFTRLGAVPDWSGGFYADPAQSGGAILDLHIHDADFVRFCFGDPASVRSSGYRGHTGGIDHVLTTYHFEPGPALVTAEGGWVARPPFPFAMQFRVVFDEAVAEYRLGREPPLLLCVPGRDPRPVDLPAGDGYDGEIAHFLDSIEAGTAPLVTMQDGAAAVRLVEAERKSIESGRAVPFRPAGTARPVA